MSTAKNYNGNVRAVKKLLREHPDGMTAPDIAAILKIRSTSISAVVRRSEMIYIDRWEARSYAEGATVKWLAVYCLIQAPADAPKPEIRPSTYLRALNGAEAVSSR